MSQHPEIIAAPFTVWIAPVGSAFPTLDEEPGEAWSLLGTNGDRNYASGGVTVSHQRQIVQPPPPAGETAATVAMTESESLRVQLQLLDITLEQYAVVMGGNAVATTPAAPGASGYKVLGLALPTGALPPFAVLARGPSPYAEGMIAQYELPHCCEAGSPRLVFTKGQPVGLSVDLLALSDPAATSEPMRFGRLVAQYAEALPPLAPAFTEAPSITDDGSPAVGETVALDFGTVTGGTITGAELLRGATVIDSDPGATYTLVLADAGQELSLRVTATGPGGETVATSDPIGPVSAGAERLAATHCCFASTRNTTNTQILSRKVLTAVTATDSLAIIVAGAAITQSAPGETALGANMTLWAEVEYPLGGARTVIEFGGNPSGTVPDGGLLKSDYTDGVLGIPAGANYAIWLFGECPAGVIYNTFRNAARGDLCQIATSGLSAASIGGSVTQTSTFSWGPQAVLVRGSSAISAGLIGDSKTAGFGDTAESTTAAGPGLRGEIAKSLDGFAFVNLATGGMQAQNWLSLATARRGLLPYFSHYIVNLGHNDAYVGNRTSAQMQGSLEAIYADILAANPAAKIIACTQTHKSASTDNYKSPENQVYNSRTAQINGLNNTIRTTGLTGADEGYFEIADIPATARDSGLWKSDGVTDFLWTIDGVHESPFGYAEIAASGAVDPLAPLQPSGGSPPPDPPAGVEGELVALLDAGGGQSSYHDFAAATNTGTWTSEDQTSLNNDFTQATASAQPAITVNGASFDAGDAVNQTITGGTFTIIFDFTKDAASTSGTLISNQAATSRLQYNDGSVSASVSSGTVKVDNGSALTTRDALHDALTAGTKRIVKVENLNMTSDTQIRIGRSLGVIRRIAVLDQTALGAGLAAAVAKAEEVMAL